MIFQLFMIYHVSNHFTNLYASNSTGKIKRPSGNRWTFISAISKLIFFIFRYYSLIPISAVLFSSYINSVNFISIFLLLDNSLIYMYQHYFSSKYLYKCHIKCIRHVYQILKNQRISKIIIQLACTSCRI